jgi:hypothetical protein
MRSSGMNAITPTNVPVNRREVADGLADRNRVRKLAMFLGLDAESVAEGLVEAVRRDMSRSGDAHRLHTAA